MREFINKWNSPQNHIHSWSEYPWSCQTLWRTFQDLSPSHQTADHQHRPEIPPFFNILWKNTHILATDKRSSIIISIVLRKVFPSLTSSLYPTLPLIDLSDNLEGNIYVSTSSHASTCIKNDKQESLITLCNRREVFKLANASITRTTNHKTSYWSNFDHTKLPNQITILLCRN